MAYAVDTAVQQVLSRLGEANDSPAAELPTGTGVATSPTVTTAAQIIVFLREGQERFARNRLLKIPDQASVSVSSATLTVDIDSITASSRVLCEVREALWDTGTATYRLHSASHDAIDLARYPPISLASGTPKYYTLSEYGVTLTPVPSGSGTLKINGFFFPTTPVAGSNFDTAIPDRLIRGLIIYAALQVAKKNAANPGLDAMIPVLEAELAQITKEGL